MNLVKLDVVETRPVPGRSDLITILYRSDHGALAFARTKIDSKTRQYRCGQCGGLTRSLYRRPTRPGLVCFECARNH